MDIERMTKLAAEIVSASILKRSAAKTKLASGIRQADHRTERVPKALRCRSYRRRRHGARRIQQTRIRIRRDNHVDAAVKGRTDKVQESIDRLEAKNTELVGDLRKARKAGEIKPEDLTAAEDRADKAEAALAELTSRSRKPRSPSATGGQGARNRAGRGSLLCARRRDQRRQSRRAMSFPRSSPRSLQW
jgi:chromosome segregation ATPase